MTRAAPTSLVPLVATTTVLATLSLNLFALPVIAPWAAGSMALDPAWIGAFTALVFGVSVLSSAAAGSFVRRWGAVAVLQACLLAAAVSACLVASGYVPLIALAAAILGAGFGPETPAASHLLSQVTPPASRAFVFSLKQIGIQLGALAAALIIPVLLLLVRWQVVMLMIGMLTLGLFIALLPMHRKYDVDREADAPIRWADLAGGVQLVFGSVSLRRLLPAAFTYSALQQSINTFLVIYFTANFDLPLATAGALLAVAQIAGVIGRIGWGVVADRWLAPLSVLWALGATMTLSAFALALIPSSASFGILAIVCALFGISGTAWNGIFVAEVVRLAPPSRSSDAIGGMIATAYAGVVVAPILCGAAVASGVSYQICFLALALGGIVGTAVLPGPEGRRAGRVV